MGLRVAIQMDHPAGLNPSSDSTIMLALEAQTRGHALWFYEPMALSFAGGALTAQPAYPVTFFQGNESWFKLGAAQTLALAEMDAVLVRQDPPFDMTYITATYLLEHLRGITQVVNDPAYLRNESEKLAILAFPDFIPPTLVTRDIALIDAFRATHTDIIVKPLYGYGGRSVYYFKANDSNLYTLLEQFFTHSREPVMVQRFLPEVAEQDKRVIMIDGEVKGVAGRIPASGEVRANFRVGGRAAKARLNPRQQHICDTVGAKLKAGGVLFAGLDLIGDYLTEINITSPTGLRAVEQLDGINCATYFWDALEALVTAPKQ